MNHIRTKLFVSRTLNVLLISVLFLTVISFVYAATPNPGHPWSEIGNGDFAVSGATTLRTYTVPDFNTSFLHQGLFVQGDIIYGSGASTTSILPKDTNATRYLSNTGASNNPAWAQINLTNGVSGILPSANGGTGNAFTTFTGPTGSFKTFTLPDATSTILTSNSAVTVGQGGTGTTTLTLNNLLVGNGASTPLFIAPGAPGTVLKSNGTTWEAASSTENVFKRSMQVLKNPGAATVTTLGFAAAPTLTATASNADDASGPLLNHATSGVNGNASGVISAFTVTRRDWEPEYITTIQSGATITSVRYWVGLFSASPDASATPNIHSAAFRYATTADGTAFWRTVTIAGTGASATVTTTSVPFTASTNYRMRIVCSAMANNCLFYINDALVATHTTTLPTATTLLGYGNRITNLSASTRSFRWGRIGLNMN